MAADQRVDPADPPECFRMPGIAFLPFAEDVQQAVELPVLPEEALPVQVARMKVPNPQISISSSTGQWSDPRTSGRMIEDFTRSVEASFTQK